MRYLLALNCGSSSVKATLFETPSLRSVQSIKASSVGTDKAELKVGDKTRSVKGESHQDIVADILDGLNVDRNDLQIVTHRIVHGAAHSKPVVVTAEHREALDDLDKLSAFAPLHNHHAVLCVRAVLEQLPKAKNVCCFDTLFHQSLSPATYTYAIPEWAQSSSSKKAVPLRRYGFHGLSYASILQSVAKHLGKKPEQTSLIVAHLGSGASMCAIRDGQSIDTSMGLTPLEGLIGGSRAGSIDPSLIFHLFDTPAEASEMTETKGIRLAKGELALNKESGLVGLCGSQEYGDIAEQAEKGSERHRLALDVFERPIVQHLGGYLLLLEGRPDALVFSGGIGEKSASLRKSISARLGFLGVKIDDKANDAASSSDDTVAPISTADSAFPVLRVLTDEETQCAQLALQTVDS